MNCREVEELLVDSLYGELGPEQAGNVRAHLDGCPKCAARLAELARVREMVGDLPEPEPSRMAVNRVLARAREAAAGPGSIWGSRWVRVLAPVGLTAAVVIVVAHQMGGERITRELQLSQAPQKSEVGKPESAVEKPSPGVVLGEREEKSGGRERLFRLEGPVPMERGDESGPSVRVESPEAGEALGLHPPERARAPVETRHRSERSAAGPSGSAPTRPAGEPSAHASMPETTESRMAVLEADSASLEDAEKLLATKAYDRAARIFSRLLARLPQGHPERPRALLGQARAYEGLGRLAEARQAYEVLARESSAHRQLARRKLEELARPDIR